MSLQLSNHYQSTFSEAVHHPQANLIMHDQETQRRKYWTEQMEAAHRFMQTMRSYPVEESGEPLVSLKEAAADAGAEVLFSKSEIAEGFERIHFLRAGLIAGFQNAAREMNERGWVLKVEDGFRSVEMQRNLSRKPSVFDAVLETTIWELNGAAPEPEFFLRRLSALTATRPKIGTHMSGSAIDISVYSRENGGEIDRGKPYLEMSEVTPMASPFIAEKAAHNRREILQIMQRNGFIAYPYEFWHFSGGDCYAEFLTSSNRPARYGAVHFDPETLEVTPIEEPDELLQPVEVMQSEIQNSLQRLANRQRF